MSVSRLYSGLFFGSNSICNKILFFPPTTLWTVCYEIKTFTDWKIVVKTWFQGGCLHMWENSWKCLYWSGFWCISLTNLTQLQIIAPNLWHLELKKIKDNAKVLSVRDNSFSLFYLKFREVLKLLRMIHQIVGDK